MAMGKKGKRNRQTSMWVATSDLSRSIVRRDTGEAYEAWLTRLAAAAGIATPTRAELARFDRKRKKKGSNDDWTHPHDPDARIMKMKDGRTHLAHTAEQAVDLATGAIVGVTVQDADDDHYARDPHHRRRTGRSRLAGRDRHRRGRRRQGVSQQRHHGGVRRAGRTQLRLGTGPRAAPLEGQGGGP